MSALVLVRGPVQQVSAQFTYILNDVGPRPGDFGPKGLVRELAAEYNGSAGLDTRGCAEAMGGAVVEGHACVHAITGFEIEVLGGGVGRDEFAACAKNDAFGQAGGA